MHYQKFEFTDSLAEPVGRAKAVREVAVGVQRAGRADPPGQKIDPRPVRGALGLALQMDRNDRDTLDPRVGRGLRPAQQPGPVRLGLRFYY